MNSAVNVLQKEANIQLKRRSLSVRKSSTPTFPLAIIIGFIGGGIRGQVVYSLSDDFIKTLTKAYKPDLLPIRRKELTLSILCEVANMISGNATISLAGDDALISVTPPVVIQAQGMMMDFIKVPTVCLMLDSSGGSLEINIAFEEGG